MTRFGIVTGALPPSCVRQVHGSPGKVIADYNALVEASNHLND
ncbi:MAG TPA: hypothetical protein VF316_24515 [Polyangiaceae bacterium]